MFRLMVLPLVIGGTLSVAKPLPVQKLEVKPIQASTINCVVPHSSEYCATHQLKVVVDNGTNYQQNTYKP